MISVKSPPKHSPPAPPPFEDEVDASQGSAFGRNSSSCRGACVSIRLVSVVGWTDVVISRGETLRKTWRDSFLFCLFCLFCQCQGNTAPKVHSVCLFLLGSLGACRCFVRLCGGNKHSEPHRQVHLLQRNERNPRRTKMRCSPAMTKKNVC